MREEVNLVNIYCRHTYKYHNETLLYMLICAVYASKIVLKRKKEALTKKTGVWC
jgi:hypothetical protein